jgi:Mg2+/citrate symporter
MQLGCQLAFPRRSISARGVAPTVVYDLFVPDFFPQTTVHPLCLLLALPLGKREDNRHERVNATVLHKDQQSRSRTSSSDAYSMTNESVMLDR